MLSDAERQAIAAHLDHLGDDATRKGAACIEALGVVQRERGWVSDDALADVAALLEMPLAELEGVATFYSLIYRRPVGRHVILLCDSVSCWIAGCDALERHLHERLALRPGTTTADGRLTLLPVACLGHCDHAPALLIDADLHGNVDAERLEAILERYR
jgi:NADH-quinone oxidoreductase subunit E